MIEDFDPNMRYALTTYDNPFDPFKAFPQWLSFDSNRGYNTSGLLARLTFSSEEISEQDQALAEYLAMVEIVTENVTGMHKLVSVPAADAQVSGRI